LVLSRLLSFTNSSTSFSLSGFSITSVSSTPRAKGFEEMGFNFANQFF
jgi:hypothetical protein